MMGLEVEVAQVVERRHPVCAGQVRISEWTHFMVHTVKDGFFEFRITVNLFSLGAMLFLIQ